MPKSLYQPTKLSSQSQYTHNPPSGSGGTHRRPPTSPGSSTSTILSHLYILPNSAFFHEMAVVRTPVPQSELLSTDLLLGLTTRSAEWNKNYVRIEVRNEEPKKLALHCILQNQHW